jgi:hypothetical protein
MAATALIPDDYPVYRGMRNPSWSKRGIISYLAFMLRAATTEFPAETELSLGLTPVSAVNELRENFGVARLSVIEVHQLPYNLRLHLDPQDDTKAEMFGLPLHSTDEAQRALAIEMASDLADIASLVPIALPQ